jgi:hypothetical protein
MKSLKSKQARGREGLRVRKIKGHAVDWSRVR